MRILPVQNLPTKPNTRLRGLLQRQCEDQEYKLSLAEVSTTICGFWKDGGCYYQDINTEK